MAYKYNCMISSSTEYGLFDRDGALRCTSPDFEGVCERKVELGWGNIRRIKLTAKGVIFGKIVE